MYNYENIIHLIHIIIIFRLKPGFLGLFIV